MKNNFEFLDSVICKIGNQIAERIPSSDRNEIEKVLGVLSNDGVYAYYVYVKSKKNKTLYNILIKDLAELMQYTDTKPEDDDYENYFINLSKNLNDLLFFKEILEETLIYARYHAKAKDKERE